jgi:NADH-quinone oxidoreductase subunit H
MISLILSLAVVLLFPLFAGYLVLAERKILADLQARLGPMRVGPHGLLQPIADALKLALKEDLIPAQASKAIFWMAPVLSTLTALTAFTVLPFSAHVWIAQVNVGILVISASTSVGILGIILGGWASNSHYSLLGALRSAAQLVSYEIALGFALLCGILSAGTLNMVGIVQQQFTRGVWFAFDNYGLMLVPFALFLIAAAAETNRVPFDLPEAESELTGGFHTEYSGLRWGFYMLAEYGNLFVAAGVAVTLFLGGWLRPFPNVAWLNVPLTYAFPGLLFFGAGVATIRMTGKERVPFFRLLLAAAGIAFIACGALFLWPSANDRLIGFFWFIAKLMTLIYFTFWVRGTVPRLRYDQLMNLGWLWLIPAGILSLFVNAIAGLSSFPVNLLTHH